jgi:hypothetical protein
MAAPLTSIAPTSSAARTKELMTALLTLLAVPLLATMWARCSSLEQATRTQQQLYYSKQLTIGASPSPYPRGEPDAEARGGANHT